MIQFQQQMHQTQVRLDSYMYFPRVTGIQPPALMANSDGVAGLAPARVGDLPLK